MSGGEPRNGTKGEKVGRCPLSGGLGIQIQIFGLSKNNCDHHDVTEFDRERNCASRVGIPEDLRHARCGYQPLSFCERGFEGVQRSRDSMDEIGSHLHAVFRRKLDFPCHWQHSRGSSHGHVNRSWSLLIKNRGLPLSALYAL